MPTDGRFVHVHRSSPNSGRTGSRSNRLPEPNRLPVRLKVSSGSFTSSKNRSTSISSSSGRTEEGEVTAPWKDGSRVSTGLDGRTVRSPEPRKEKTWNLSQVVKFHHTQTRRVWDCHRTADQLGCFFWGVQCRHIFHAWSVWDMRCRFTSCQATSGVISGLAENK